MDRRSFKAAAVNQRRQYESPVVRFALWCVGVILIVATPFVGYGVIMRVMDAQASEAWPVVKGTVLESRVEEKQHGPQKRSFATIVSYQYQVEGKQYTSSKVGHFATGYSQRSDADAVVARYPAKGQVDVRYRPQDAADAVLEPGLAPMEYLWLALPAAFLAFGVVICWTAFYYTKRAARRARANQDSAEK